MYCAKAAGLRLAVDRVTIAQETHNLLIDSSGSEYVPHAIPCTNLDDYGANNVSTNEPELSFNQDNFQKTVLTILNNFLNLSDSVSNKHANNFLKWITADKEEFLLDHERFKHLTDIR